MENSYNPNMFFILFEWKNSSIFSVNEQIFQFFTGKEKWKWRRKLKMEMEDGFLFTKKASTSPNPCSLFGRKESRVDG
jgi:hypothetical protein